MAGNKIRINQIALAITIALTSTAQAVGTGEIISGSGSISQNQSNTTVTQKTDKMVINWDNMDIGKNEAMRFNQPTSNAAVLNRVNAIDPTLIQGALSANGRVFIVNPNGVLIGNGAAVNVGSLVASSLDIKDADFMQGEMTFSGKGKGRVINEGNIKALNSVVLMGAGEVSNKGNITAGSGNASLAAGEEITLSFPSRSKINVKIDKGSLTALVNNGGMIVTKEGSIALTAWATDALTRSVINNTGTLEASQVYHRPDGVYLESMGNGSVDIAGNTLAREIAAKGKNINIKDGAELENNSSTHLITTVDNGHVKFGKASLHGDVSITANNVLTEGAGHQPTFFDSYEVSIASSANNLNVGASSVTDPSQIKPGEGIISEGMVDAVAKSNSRLFVTATAGGDITLDNAGLNYGDLTLENSSGNININNTTNGNSLAIYSGRASTNQPNDVNINMTNGVSIGADINMAKRVSIMADNSISQNGNITAGNEINIRSEQGDIIQSKGKYSTAHNVNYSGNLTLNGRVTASSLSLYANDFSQDAQSSLEAKEVHLLGGNFNLTSGEHNFDSIHLNANSLDLLAHSDTQIADNSHLKGDLRIKSDKDVSFGILTVDGSVNVAANNITSRKTSSEYDISSIATGKDAVLNAQNDINLNYVKVGGCCSLTTADMQLSGKSITVADASASGNITAVSQDNMNLGYINSMRAVKLTAGNDIVSLGAISSNDNMSLSAGGDVKLVGNVTSQEGNVTISANNITAQNNLSTSWYAPSSSSIISSGKDTVLTAKNDIDMSSSAEGQPSREGSESIHSNGKVQLSGKNITTGYVYAFGDITVVAQDNISLASANAREDMTLTAGKDIVSLGAISSNDTLSLSAGGDVKLGGSVASQKGNVTISANNITAQNNQMSWYEPSIISSGKDTVLAAKNNIDVVNIRAGKPSDGWSVESTPSNESIQLSGKNILARDVTAQGAITVVADNEIAIQDNLQANKVDLLAKDNITAGEVSGQSSVKATSTMGEITFQKLSKTDNKDLSAAKGVHIANDFNSSELDGAYGSH